MGSLVRAQEGELNKKPESQRLSGFFCAVVFVAGQAEPFKCSFVVLRLEQAEKKRVCGHAEKK
jgi:hypothetical protein